VLDVRGLPNDLLEWLRTVTEPVVVVFDPDGMLDETSLDGADVEVVRDWYELRGAYELTGRRRRAGERPLVLIARSRELRSERDLPWDIRRRAALMTVRASVRRGRSDVPAAERVSRLLDDRPEPWPPQTVGGWEAAAVWWGEVRDAAARVEPADAAAVADAAWGLWGELDVAFRAWLERSYGELLTSSAALPRTVDKIAPFLSRRLRGPGCGRVALVVLDGMAFSQWASIQHAVSWRVERSAACFAMLPTLTSISRQAIFAGAPPSRFPRTLATTAEEERAWRAFWTEQGLDASAIRYVKLLGAHPREVDSVFAGDAPSVLGVVVEALDKMLHGSKVFGDRQMAGSVDLWLDAGFLDALVARALAEGYEVWIVADHGNIEALGVGGFQGDAVTEMAGKRVRTFRHASVRDHQRAKGLAWDPPGLPPDSIHCLFPSGRDGYFSRGAPRLTHGGLSLDEVLVPLAQVRS
jgi:PglZ domain